MLPKRVLYPEEMQSGINSRTTHFIDKLWAGIPKLNTKKEFDEFVKKEIREILARQTHDSIWMVLHQTGLCGPETHKWIEVLNQKYDLGWQRDSIPKKQEYEKPNISVLVPVVHYFSANKKE